MGTAEQPPKGEVVLPITGFVPSCKDGLDPVKGREVDQRRMGSFVFDALPKEIPQVEPALKHLFEVGPIDLGPGLFERYVT